MGATIRAIPGRVPGLRTSALKKPLSFRKREYRLVLDPEGHLRSFDSLAEHRSAFGYERLAFYKVQAGVIVQSQRPDWAIRASPDQVLLAGRPFDGIEASQSIEFFRGASAGYLRRVKLKNAGAAAVRLRVVDIIDPTASQLGEASFTWGALGVNAFNRGSHVAMDEISDLRSARVVGSAPQPRKIFMTVDRTRIKEVLAAGDLSDSTAGMSGQVIIAMLHELDLAPSEQNELIFASIYNPAKLEEALSDFGRLQADAKSSQSEGPVIATSSPNVTDALAWALSSVQSARFEVEGLDLIESLRGLSFVDREGAVAAFESIKKTIGKEGAVCHSSDWGEPGALETALLLRAITSYLRDKKRARAVYPLVRKLSSFLMKSSEDFRMRTDPRLPQGWRRLLGRGYPSGEVPEVSLAAAGALSGAAQVSRQLSKAEDAGRFMERAEMLAEMVRKRLVDERGFLSLCLDPSGSLRGDETADMAVAAYRHGFLKSAEQAAAHRLLEKDFETTYGPRTVPTSNHLYFNSGYGQGQLGGFWTRAALAHASLCYRVGLPAIASLALEKVAKLAVEDVVGLGGAPGEFPYWVDVEGREAHGEGSDPVAAARFIETMLEGELGLEPGPMAISTVAPPDSSSLRWAFAFSIWAGETVSLFVGRAGGKAWTFGAGSHIEVKHGEKYAKAGRLMLQSKGLHGLSFTGPGEVICVGNSSPTPIRGVVQFSPSAPELARRLSTPLEEFDPTRGSWTKTSTLRVLPTISFETGVGPGDWKAYRVSTP